MRIQIFSDLHFDAASGGWIPWLAPGADLIVCAGDVCEGLDKGFTFLRSFFPDTPIVTVAGNHSFYRRCLPEELEAGRAAAKDCGIHFLENDTAVIGGVRFIGATLWTDYELFGEGRRFAAMDAARRGMNDHRFITWQKQPWMRFRPEEALQLHRRSRAYLKETLTAPHDGPTVVVTHHAPLAASVPAKYASDVISAAYASDMPSVIWRHQPALWIHGHTHTSFDYMAGGTRVICNPHGYGRENAAGFDPELVLRVEAPASGIEAASGRQGAPAE